MCVCRTKNFGNSGNSVALVAIFMSLRCLTKLKNLRVQYMKIDIRRISKIVSLPLAILFLLPFADFLYWGDSNRMPMLERVWIFWSVLPSVIYDSFVLFVIPILIEIILLVRWILHPCLRTGIWLAIGTFFCIGPPICIFACSGYLFSWPD